MRRAAKRKTLFINGSQIYPFSSTMCRTRRRLPMCSGKRRSSAASRGHPPPEVAFCSELIDRVRHHFAVVLHRRAIVAPQLLRRTPTVESQWRVARCFWSALASRPADRSAGRKAARSDGDDRRRPLHSTVAARGLGSARTGPSHRMPLGMRPLITQSALGLKHLS